VTRSGRFATVTNFAEEADGLEPPLSRGALVGDFLRSEVSAHHFAHEIHGADYRGFNLLTYDGSSLAYTSNRGFTEDLTAGVYGLANAELGAAWPKVVSGREALARIAHAPDTDTLIRLLHDDHQPDDADLPKRGRPLDLERRVAPCFIRGEEYGTRASTAVIFDARQGKILFAEQLYLAGGEAAGYTEQEILLG
jgi:uncharacterized protein with NRDE domain